MYFQDQSQPQRQEQLQNNRNKQTNIFTKKNDIEFYFPDNSFNEVFFKDIHSIKSYLKDQRSLWKNTFKITSNGVYVYLKCKYHCQARISLKKDPENEILRVHRFNNCHNHPLKKDKIRQEQQIKNFLAQNNIDMSSVDARTILMKVFMISSKRFYYLKGKIENQYSTFQDFIDKLKKLDYRVYTSRIRQMQSIPHIVIVSSIGMVKQYLCFYDCVRFDITYSVIKTRSAEGKKWNLGIFSGFRQDNSPCIFALVMIIQQTVDSFVQMWDAFFNLMGIVPETIITDQQTSLISALARLKQRNVRKYTYFHLLDQFHILQSIKDKIPIAQQKEFIVYFKHFLYTKSAQILKENYQNIKNISNLTLQTYLNRFFYTHIEMFCQSQSPKAFHGVSITTSPAQKLNDMIKTKIRYETTFHKLTFTIENIMSITRNRFIHNEDSHLLSAYEDLQLQKVRKALSKKIFFYFFQKYIKCIEVQILGNLSQAQQKLKSKQDDFDEFFNGFKIEVFDNTYSDDLFFITINYCTCGDAQRSGLSCRHILALRRRLKISYVNAIAVRWIIRGPPEKSYGSRPRKSRRNRKK